MLQIQDAAGGQTTSVPAEIAGCVGVFRDMIATVTDKNQEPVILDETAESFALFVKWLFRDGEVGFTRVNVEMYLIMSDKYDIPALKNDIRCAILTGDVSYDAYEKYVLGVTYDIKDLVTRNKSLVMDNFEKFLDEQFPAMVNNGSLHGTTVDLIKLALTKRAEKADKVILALEAKVADMRTKVTANVRAGVRYNNRDEIKAVLDDCWRTIRQYRGGQSAR